MAGKKQQAPKPAEDDSDETEEGWDSNAVEVDADGQDQAGGRMRDWRDVEKYREMRELRRLVGDEFDFTDVLGEIPIRTANSPRPQIKPPAPKGAAAKAAPVAPAKAGKTAPPAPPAKAAPKPLAKPAPAPPKPAAKKGDHKTDHKPAPKAAAKKPAKPPVKAKAKKK